jgi:tRNA(adenine34) deaminase
MEEESALNDEYFMRKALQQAEIAYDEGEIPIGAVVVHQNKIIGKGYNQTEKLVDVTAHAEMLAITSAEQYLSSKYLYECSLYVTIEPCVMCAGAIQWARFSKVVFGAKEPKSGYTQKSMNLISSRTEIISGILEVDCAELMKNFFSSKRSL